MDASAENPGSDASRRPSDAIAAMLDPAPDGTPHAHMVSTRVNNPRDDVAMVIVPIASYTLDIEFTTNGQLGGWGMFVVR